MQKHRIRCGSVLVVLWLALSCADSALGWNSQDGSARGMGMGNAFTAAADDPSAVFYNPAGLSDIRTWMFHVHYARESKYGRGENEKPFQASGSMVMPLNDDFTFAMCGLKKGSWADPTAMVSNNVEGLSLASRMNPDLAVGVSFKSIHNSNYGNQKGTDFDLGLLYRLGPDMRLGLVLKNLLAAKVHSDAPATSTLNGDPTRTARIGLLRHLDMLAGDLTFDLAVEDLAVRSGSGFLRSSLGVETQVLTSGWLDFKLRGGYTLGDEYGHQIRQPAVGWGVRFRGARSACDIDYGWQGYPHQSDETSVGDHHVSITIYPRVRKAEDKVLPGRNPAWANRAWITPDLNQDALSPTDRQNLETSVHAQELTIGKGNFILFLVELGVDVRVAGWKLYVYPGNAGDISKDQTGLQPLGTLQGWIMPANSILWDLKVDGNKLPHGIYCCRLEISCPSGDIRSSDLTQFRVR